MPSQDKPKKEADINKEIALFCLRGNTIAYTADIFEISVDDVLTSMNKYCSEANPEVYNSLFPDGIKQGETFSKLVGLYNLHFMPKSDKRRDNAKEREITKGKSRGDRRFYP